MTPREMIIFHLAVYHGMNLNPSKSAKLLDNLRQALKIPMDDYVEILKDMRKSMDGMVMLEPITEIKY